jgi:hypothetical protein
MAAGTTTVRLTGAGVVHPRRACAVEIATRPTDPRRAPGLIADTGRTVCAEALRPKARAVTHGCDRKGDRSDLTAGP